MHNNEFAVDGCGVKFESNQGSIASGAERISGEIGIHPLPGMFYDTSGLRVSLGCAEIVLSPIDALACCRIQSCRSCTPSWSNHNPPTLVDPDIRQKVLNQLKVQHSEKWMSARSPSEAIPQMEVAHDWTYTSTYWGSVSGGHLVSEVRGSECTETFLPMDIIADPSKKILWYREVYFWEDELEDNGFSRCCVRVRAMADFFFLLSKFEMRLDGVLESRSIETRYFYDYKAQRLLRDFRWLEAGSRQQQFSVQQVFEV